mmetsp:Transcript_18717/g.55958  ORF Transcript_18717/g.55958 Transcript_18717/m.55958 type:complete len:311 (-) Transcript_18717:232-1164(-)
MFVEVRLVPLRVLVEGAILPDLVGVVAQHEHAGVLREDQALHEAAATRPVGAQVVVGVDLTVAATLYHARALGRLLAPLVEEGLLAAEGVVLQADIRRARDDAQPGAHEHADGAVRPEKALKQILPLLPAASDDLATGEGHLQLDADLLEQTRVVRRRLDAGASDHAANGKLLQLRDNWQRPTGLHQQRHQLPHGDHRLHPDGARIGVDVQDVHHAVHAELETPLLVRGVLDGDALPTGPGGDDPLGAASLPPLLQLRQHRLDLLAVEVGRALHGLDVRRPHVPIHLVEARERQDERQHQWRPVHHQELL